MRDSGSVGEVMATLFHVKTRLFLVLWFAFAGALFAEEQPDAQEVLRTVRNAQSSQNRSLTGHVRGGGKTIPFKLSISGGVVRWEFSDPPQTLVLRLGEKEARLEEIGKGGPEKVGPARYDDKVRDTEITYEDLSMQFLYWRNAKVEGEQTMVLQKCWIVVAEPPSKGASQYSRVKLWISKENGALMQAEAYDQGGKLARRFKVISGQKTSDGLWILKSMRIETPSTRPGSAFTQTYLEIDHE